MNDFVRAKTTTTLDINFKSSGDFSLKGICVPENAIALFSPLFEWVREFKENPSEKIALNMHIDYLNTASVKMLVDLIKQLGSIHNDPTKLSLIWIFEDGDSDMREFGEELELLTGFKISLKPIRIL